MTEHYLTEDQRKDNLYALDCAIRELERVVKELEKAEMVTHSTASGVLYDARIELEDKLIPELVVERNRLP